MIVAVAVLARLGAQLGLALAIGSNVFLLLAGPGPDSLLCWRRRITRTQAAAALLALLGIFLALLVQAAAVLQQPWSTLLHQPAVLCDFVGGTVYGRAWLCRVAAVAILLLASLSRARGVLERLRPVAMLAAGTAALIAGGWSSHAAGEAAYLLPVQIAHVLAVSLWVGALPAWIALVHAAGAAPDPPRCGYAALALRRFSRLASICVLVIVASGVVLAWNFIGGQGDLLGTAYGLLVCAKVALLGGALLIAQRVRRRFLDGMDDPQLASTLYRHARMLVSAELALALLVLLLASTLGQTTPASHAQPHWWLPFRISVAATWPLWATPAGLYTCIAAAVLAAGTGAWLLGTGRSRRQGVRLGIVAAVAAAIGVALAWQLSVPAYPDTFRRSEVAYLTVSIAHGQASYAAHCTACHGAGGLGDGPAAAGLPRPPANLSQPHTALHTAGDMYWWMGHGIPRSGMPGFASVLDDEDRWDLVNFLRAFSQGFQARILGPQVVPFKPWLGAPDFYFEQADGSPGQLRDFRGNSAVLLVFPAPVAAGSETPLAQLLRAAKSWPGLVVIAVGDQAALAAPTIVITSGAGEIRGSYELLSRTAANRGDPQSIGLPRGEMAFLIDRFGYIRARWIPEEEPQGWSDPEQLHAQVLALAREPQILPPPDEHVH